ncbi:MAG TPA: DNA polymerase III subunit delta [Tenuifilaceae bacterium]|nr:DNA polymerase III subunit delta [Tenuifilaceae bacterium]HPJ45796.1 DNA polymerase III subunit delta [Tenuifilaceae bacterium]HRX68159.1 DNA polymerase III subunit delta [Tenuifilaceae bacterium]
MAKRSNPNEACEEILSELKKKIFKPIYILSGDEFYYIDRITDFIAENVLSESERAFNQVVLYGKDVDVPYIIETSRRFPMMANQQVVIVKEAQNIKKLEDLETYLKAPLKSTILVLNLKYTPTQSGRPGEKLKKLFNLASKIGVYFESSRLYDYQVPAWITQHLKSKGFTIEPASAELLKDYLGNDLSKVVKELEKLVITLPADNRRITVAHIEKNIGISKDFNRFEFCKAIGERNILKVNRIVDYFAKNPKASPLFLTISSVYQYFHKIFSFHFLKDKNDQSVAVALRLNPFFVSEYKNAARIYNPAKCVQVFSLLREYDMRSKGVNNDSTDEGELLKELIFRIMH